VVWLAVLAAAIGLAAYGLLALAGSTSDAAAAGGWELTIQVPHASFDAGDDVVAVATLTYRGDDPRRTFGFAAGGPVAFGVVMPDGTEVPPAYRDVCRTGVADRNIVVPYQRTFELPVGRSLIWAEADITPGGCGATGERVQLRAEVEIEVRG
jgi:hypothetical protein